MVMLIGVTVRVVLTNGVRRRAVEGVGYVYLPVFLPAEQKLMARIYFLVSYAVVAKIHLSHPVGPLPLHPYLRTRAILKPC